MTSNSASVAPESPFIFSSPSSDADVAMFEKAIAPYEGRNCLGVEARRSGETKGTPIHVNVKKNPNPCVIERMSNWRNRKYKIRIPKGRNTETVMKHLFGDNAYFHKAKAPSSKRRKSGAPRQCSSLHAMDFDSDGASFEICSDYAQMAIAQHFPSLAPFVEPSRSYDQGTGRGGCYLWFRVNWATGDPGVRNALLNALGRALKMSLPIVDGVHLDTVKGTFSFLYPNPKFDIGLAHGPGIGQMQREVYLDEEWKVADDMPWKIAKDLERREVFVASTVVQDYERYKAFYGTDQDTMTCDPAVRFPYNEALEMKLRNFGVLVTAPCYKALSGTRPNNIAKFAAWLENGAGEITESQIRALLTDHLGEAPESWIEDQITGDTYELTVDYVELPRQFGSNPEIEKKILDVYGRKRDTRMYLNPTLPQIDRYRAATWMVLRVLGLSDRSAIEQTVLYLVALPCGPATGECHEGRRRQVSRIVDWCITHFKQERSISFDDDNVGQILPLIQERIPKAEIARLCAEHKGAQVNEKCLAYALCVMLKLIHTNHRGEIGSHAIGKWLSDAKVIPGDTGKKRAAVAIILKLLTNTEAGLIVKARKHFNGNGQGRAAAYALHPRCVPPAWLLKGLASQNKHLLIAPGPPDSLANLAAATSPCPIAISVQPSKSILPFEVASRN